MSTPTPAHVENSVEFATPLSHDEERIDAYHDDEQLRYRTMENLLDDQPVPGLAPHDLEAQLRLACDDGEPQSFTKAERHAAWRAAMQSEMDAVKKNCTWELADLPRGHRAITLEWVFKLKRDEADAIVKHKARLVARGFVQWEGIDFDDTFTHVARMESVRLLFALAAQEGWRVHHMDVKSAFLNGDLKEEIYVHQPPGFTIPGKEGKVCARPFIACGRLHGHGISSWTPRSRRWASDKARTRRPSIGGAMEEMPCWWVSTSTTW
jgi:hypothetical protein